MSTANIAAASLKAARVDIRQGDIRLVLVEAGTWLAIDKATGDAIGKAMQEVTGRTKHGWILWGMREDGRIAMGYSSRRARLVSIIPQWAHGVL